MKKISIITITALILLLSGCVTSLKDVKDDTQTYAGKTIQIKGDITKVQKIPFTDFSVLLFKDGDVSTVIFTPEIRKITSGVNMKGKVIAIREDIVNDSSSTAVESLSSFLVDHDFAERERAEKISSAAMKIVRTLSKGIGSFFFIIEQ